MNRRGGEGRASPPFCSTDDIDSCPLRHVTFYDRYRAVNDFSRRNDTSRIHPRFVSPPLLLLLWKKRRSSRSSSLDCRDHLFFSSFFFSPFPRKLSITLLLPRHACVFPISIRWIPVSLNTREKESKGNYNRKLVMERKEQIKEWLFPPSFVIRN